MPSETPWWSEKALWIALFSAFFPPLSKKLGVPIDPMQMATLAVVVASVIAAHTHKRGKPRKAPKPPAVDKPPEL
jgi:hypothetical protein